MHLRSYSAVWSTLLAAMVVAAPPFQIGTSEDHDSRMQALSRRVEIANQTTVGLPDDSALSNASALPPKRYIFTYSHDKLDVQEDASSIAVHFGSNNLSWALDAAIDHLTYRPRTLSQPRQTQLNASFNHLSLIITPAIDIV